MICAALFALLAPHQTVTITLPPTRLSEALPLIAKAANQRLSVSGALQDEVVFVHATNVDPKPLLTHLAACLYARWESKEDGSQQLVIDATALTNLKKEEDTKSRETLVKSLEYVAERLRKQPAQLDAAFIKGYRERKAQDDARRKAAQEAEDWAQVFVSADVLEETPSWRAAGRIAPLLGIDQLLSMPTDSKEVWAEQPTSVQKPFPPAVRQILANYRRELSLLDPESQVHQVLVSAQRWESGGSFNIFLKAYDGTGKVIDQGFLRLNNDGERMKVPYNQRDIIKPLPDEKPIVIPQEATDARTFLAATGDQAVKDSLFPIWKPIILNPIQNEPTQWHLGTSLLTLAKDTNRNIAGTLSDFIGSRYWEAPKDTPSQLLTKNAAFVKEAPDGWLVAYPNEKITRLSRTNAMALLAECDRSGGLSVDAAAKWIGNSPDRYASVTWLGDYVGALLPGVGPYSAIATLGNDQALRLWTTFSSSTMRALRAGETINLANLSSASKTHIQKLVYWWDAIEGEKEPTDQFPNGIDSGTLKMTITEKPLLIAWNASQGRPVNPMAMDAKSLGTGLAKGSTYYQISPEIYQSYNRFIIGVHRSYRFEFSFNPGPVPMELTVGETFFDPKTTAVDRLPSNISAEVEKARVAALAKPTAPSVTTTPPPR